LEAEMATTEKPLYDSPCLHSIITLADAQLQTMVDAITYVIAFWYLYFCNIIKFQAHMSIAGNVHQHLSCIISSSFLASLFYICPFW
jgi:hypothetical protein